MPSEILEDFILARGNCARGPIRFAAHLPSCHAPARLPMVSPCFPDGRISQPVEAGDLISKKIAADLPEFGSGGATKKK